jgi:hypothetical protein
MKLFFSYFFLLTCISISSCNNSGGVKTSDYAIKLKEQNIQLNIGQKRQLELQNTINAAVLGSLQWKSSDPEVASVTDKGVVDALKEGEATITVRYKSTSDSCKVQVLKQAKKRPLSLAPLHQSLSNTTVYSKDVQLVAPFRVVQCFGLDNQGNIYYSQIGAANGFKKGKTKSQYLYIIKGKPNKHPSGHMDLKYFGHGGQIAVEDENGEAYVWVPSNATKYSSGEYWDSRSVSRIKYEAGKEYVGQGGKTYFLNNGIFRIEAAISRESNLICINASKNGVRYFYTYKLSEVEALPETDFNFSVKVGGEEIGTKEHVVSRTVKGYDLSKLTPLGQFHIPKGSNMATDPNTLHFQGYDIDASGHIYFFEGNGNDNNKTGGSSHAYVSIFDIDGHMLKHTKVSAIENVGELVNKGITNSSGYMEGEGIKIKGNKIYLEFASHQGEKDYRRANIFEYDSHRK